eukprot:331646_1
MSHLIFKCIIIMTYLLLHLVNCQYTQIWYDNMEANSGWTVNGDDDDDVVFNYPSSSCTSGYCVKMTAKPAMDRVWMRKHTDVSRYSSHRVEYDVSVRGLESTDSCSVYYSYTGSSVNDRELLQSHTASDGDRYSYSNNIINLPDASTSNNLWIWLETCCGEDNDATTHDVCYWDDVYLQGIFASTANPTKNPSETRTSNPSSTVDPTNTPSRSLTSPPTSIPTCGPTLISTISPTVIPSAQLTSDPSSVTTRSTTHKMFTPTKAHSTVPTVLITPAPTKVRTLPTVPTTHQTLAAPQPSVTELSTSANQFPAVTPILYRQHDPLLIIYVAAGAVSFIIILTAVVFYFCRAQTKIQEIDKRISANISNHNLYVVTNNANSSDERDDEGDVVRINCNDDDDETVKGLEDDQESEGCDEDTKATTRGSVMHISDDVVPNDDATGGNDVNEEQKEE